MSPDSRELLEERITRLERSTRLWSPSFRLAVIASVCGSTVFILLLAGWRILGFLASSVWHGFGTWAIREATCLTTSAEMMPFAVFPALMTGCASALTLRDLLDRSRSKRKKIADSVLLAVMSCACLFYVVSTVTIQLGASLSESFRRAEMKLAPYLTDQEVEELRAKWASMEDWEDLEAIDAELTTLRKQFLDDAEGTPSNDLDIKSSDGGAAVGSGVEAPD